jgi:hypothetical protein
LRNSKRYQNDDNDNLVYQFYIFFWLDRTGFSALLAAGLVVAGKPFSNPAIVGVSGAIVLDGMYGMDFAVIPAFGYLRGIACDRDLWYHGFQNSLAFCEDFRR